MGEWTVTAVDPDAPEDGRGTVATLTGSKADAMLWGCEALADGWADVYVDGPFGARVAILDPLA